jgi:hypothetical protein
MLNETTTGERLLEEGVRVWSDPERPVEWLGRPEWEHQTVPGTRMLSGSTITFGDSGIAMRCEPLLANYVAMGTGYGIDPDWRHGQYQGPELVVQHKDWARDEVAGSASTASSTMCAGSPTTTPTAASRRATASTSTASSAPSPRWA